MCRAGGRRCDRKWDDAHRERYNARRRVVRNTQKAQAASAVGDDEQTAYYKDLAHSARDAADHYDTLIRNHEETSATQGDAPEVDYRMGHTAPVDDGYSNPITRLTDGFFGDDVYEHPDWYGVADEETMQQLTTVRDDPQATVRVYRAVPHDHPEINSGDWVTLSRDYAEEHAFDLDAPGVDGEVVSMEVPATQVFTDGNDLAEYGYTGPSTPLGEAADEAASTSSLEQVREASRQWQAGLSDQEAEAFEVYGSVEHEGINAKLRAGQTLTGDEKTTVDAMDHALQRAPRTDQPSTLYRGIGFSETTRGELSGHHWVAQYCPEGSDVTFDSFTSTSTETTVAQQFSGAASDHTTSGVLFEIETTQSGYTGDSPESEVLLQRGSHFTVTSASEETTINGKPFHRVRLRETGSPTPRVVEQDHPLAARPSGPMELSFIRNPVSSTEHVSGAEFGQDIEPSGRYVTQSAGVVPDGWQSGTVTFQKPLHMDWGASGSYVEEDNWKQRLSAHYGGKTGKALSTAVRTDGYDAIVTHDKYGTSEIVDLTNVQPARGTARTSSSHWDRRKKYAPRDSRDFGKYLAVKHGISVDLTGGRDPNGYVTLHKIEVPEEQRGRGLGTKAMRELLAEADRNGWKLNLTPSNSFGGSVTRLKKFYRNLGFVPNKGHNKDFTTSEDFLRPPQ